MRRRRCQFFLFGRRDACCRIGDTRPQAHFNKDNIAIVFGDDVYLAVAGLVVALQYAAVVLLQIRRRRIFGGKPFGSSVNAICHFDGLSVISITSRKSYRAKGGGNALCSLPPLWRAKTPRRRNSLPVNTIAPLLPS